MHQGLFYSLGFRDTTTGSEESLLHVVSKVKQKTLLQLLARLL